MDFEVSGGGNENSEVCSSSLTVEPSLSLADTIPKVIGLCKDLFKKWSHIDSSQFLVETVSGGITNLLLKVSVEEENNRNVSVAVRLYGPHTEYVINRERELEAIRNLSAAGFGAKLLGVFGNGMVQSFINARTLNETDMRESKMAAEIAKQLNRFHKVEVPGNKETQLWNDTLMFFEKASTLKFDDVEKKKKYKTISFDDVFNEIFDVKELSLQINSPVVFSHNDLLCGNLMFNAIENKLYIIDFEYGMYNYRGFDIGNHFNEYAGYECDYSLYPSIEEQRHFFRHYLGPNKPEEVSEDEIEALYIETNTLMLASHLYWGLWALIQAKMSAISFDYMGYFFKRYEEYKSRKQECFCLARSYLSRANP